jgi:phage shock protein PspC (stress-responsive transcriptional regulator)
MVRKLRRGTDRVLGGVCSGIAAHYDTDATAIRILWAVLSVFTGVLPGVLAYLICWALIPSA